MPVEKLGKLDLGPDGSVTEQADRDIHLSVGGLLLAFLHAMLPMCAVAVVFASRHGLAK